MNAVEQRLTALEEANRVRLGQYGLRKQIAHGETTAAEVIREQEFPTMTIGSVLGAQHRWGKHRVRHFCTVAGVTETKRIGTLTERQVNLICEQLGEA